MNMFILILLLLTFISSNIFASELSNDETLPEYTFISITSLITEPLKYHGHKITVAGHLSIELENMSLCSTRHTVSTKDCIWVRIDEGPYDSEQDLLRYKKKERKFRKYHGKPVLISGIYDKDDTGHMGGWSGAIYSITDNILVLKTK